MKAIEQGNTGTTVRRPFVEFTDLPFVGRTKKGARKGAAKNWSVPSGEDVDYPHACQLGQAYAAHFIRYLSDNPGMAGGGGLGHIASDIDFADKSDAQGVWVGFFSYLERYILRGSEGVDPYRDLIELRAYYAREEAKRDLANGAVAE